MARISLRGRVGRTLKHTIASASEIFGRGADAETETLARKAMLSMVRTILESDGPLNDREINTFRELLSDHYSPFEIERMVGELSSSKAVTPEEAATVFLNYPIEERARVIQLLLALAADTGVLDSHVALIQTFSAALELSDAEFHAVLSDVENKRRSRSKILRSGAGILVALMVIAVFILTATLLRSVIFGLIAAYVLLPVEKYFERRIRAKRGGSYLLIVMGGLLVAPLRSLAEGIRRRTGTAANPTPEEREQRNRRKVITQAVGLTCSLLLLLFTVLVILLSNLTSHYVGALKSSVRDWTQNPPPITEPAVPAPQPGDSDDGVRASSQEETLAFNGAGQLLIRTQDYLERLRFHFERLPWVKFGLDQISNLLNDQSAQRELATLLLKRTGGIFSFTAGVIGMIGAIVADLLLTVFFFLLFLLKLAEFCDTGESANKQSEYLVRTVFNGNWLPGAREETVAEAQRIIGGVISRLRTWVRGYLTLMLVDGSVYTTAFFFLRVPYFLVLGPLAGCGILLPYIGPILSAALTILVTLAVGGENVTAMQLVGIAATYLIYNGVIEQFILYPAVIGESLGLTTLETIIVVLLGAIFAGIPGMIFAIPAASVLKFLVPQIYRCWGPSENHHEEVVHEKKS